MRPDRKERLHTRGPHRVHGRAARGASALRGSGRVGFTLVEMLVSTLLVVIILLMFAQIFLSATGTMSKQRALALNDQRARLVSTVIREDLKNATFGEAPHLHAHDLGLTSNAEELVEFARGIAPIQNLDPATASQRGFFRIDENGSSDILHFTAMVDLQSGELPYVGKATALSPNADLNQPEMDDGVSGNQTGSSRAVEVVIFVRNGTLYRVQKLLRDPLYRWAPRYDEQPKSGTYGVNSNFTEFQTSGSDFNYVSAAGASFWNDFDYSAYRADIDGDSMTAGDEIRFNGISSLDNTRGLINHPIAILSHRYPRNGALPFTMEETSDSGFTYPGSGNAKPAAPGASGTRKGEDILLTNVDSFEIKVWDPTSGGNGDFVDLGTAGTIFSASTTYDTWHPVATGAPNRPTLTDTSATTPSMYAVSTGYSVDDVVYTTNATDPIVYLCLSAGTSGTVAPSWPGTLGAYVGDGGVKWLAIENRVGLKMIQITIRYRDLSSDQPRQVTLVHSFLE